MFANPLSRETLQTQPTALGGKISPTSKRPASGGLSPCRGLQGHGGTVARSLCQLGCGSVQHTPAPCCSLPWRNTLCLALWQSPGADVEGDRPVSGQRSRVWGSLSDQQDDFEEKKAARRQGRIPLPDPRQPAWVAGGCVQAATLPTRGGVCRNSLHVEG